jgi:tRNA pseudouridine38-40 synthase
MTESLPIRTFKLTIAYDGSGFHGWQVQPGFRTIQGTLSEVGSQITQDKIFIQGASRTDAGVHALGQVAHFRAQTGLPAAELMRAFNALLPPQIRVMEAEQCSPSFHSRWLAQAKTYHYRIYQGAVLPPFEFGRALHHPWPLDEAAMVEAARLFEGEHDFTAFSASSGSEEDDRDRSGVRVVYSSELRRTAIGGVSAVVGGHDAGSVPGKESHELTYVIRGQSFLRYMVRKLVGTLLDVGRGKIQVAQIPDLFAARDRSLTGATVPPDGLCLVALEYPDPTSSIATQRGSARTPRTATRER